jgi:ribosomal protein S18 acetylase RimI-like enzyme
MDFAAFHAFHVPALEADEARHYMLLSALADLAAAPRQDFRGWTFDGPGACAVQPLPDYAVMLGELSEAQCRLLADEVEGKHLRGVMGPGEGPDWFVARGRELGFDFDPPLRNGLYCLETRPAPPDVVGAPRGVTAADTALFVEWMRAYMREALPRDPVPDRFWLERWAADGSYRFWTIEGQPVSVAGMAAETRTGAAITGVYTPPQHRGRGYGAAVTAAVARGILDHGRRAFLMANVTNAPALRCYAKIGFCPVGSFTHYWRKYA